MRRSSAITPLGGGTNELLIETLAMMAYPVHAAGKYPIIGAKSAASSVTTAPAALNA
jgi:hypothetical protein